jgi:phosphate transport system substrate-binding protein
MQGRVNSAGAGVLLAALVAAPVAAQQLTGAGATFPFPLYSKWFDAYHQANPGTTINYQSIGSGGGIQQLKAGTVDFGASDAPLSDEERSSMPGPVVHIPTVAGAVVLTYHVPGAPNGLKLAGPVIADIFLGKVTRWNDGRIAGANPGVKLPATAIAVAHRSDGSGTSYIFTHYLSAVSPEWKGKVGAGKSVNWPVGLGGKGNEGVSGLV